jgi:hypothetical protein
MGIPGSNLKVGENASTGSANSEKASPHRRACVSWSRSASSARRPPATAACRGAWARVTIDRLRNLSLITFKKHRASTEYVL